MWMSEGDIAGKYREAKNKKVVIKILAEVNQCEEDEIKKIVEKYGYKIPSGKTSSVGSGKGKIQKKTEKEVMQMPAKKIVEKNTEKTKEVNNENIQDLKSLKIPTSVWAGIVEKRTELIDEIDKRKKELEAMEKNFELLEKSLSEHEKFLSMLDATGGAIG